MRRRADAEAPGWWPRRLLWLWRWVFRPAGRLLEVTFGAFLDAL